MMSRLETINAIPMNSSGFSLSPGKDRAKAALFQGRLI
jgi:hypothetical protein